MDLNHTHHTHITPITKTHTNITHTFIQLPHTTHITHSVHIQPHHTTTIKKSIPHHPQKEYLTPPRSLIKPIYTAKTKRCTPAKQTQGFFMTQKNNSQIPGKHITNTPDNQQKHKITQGNTHARPACRSTCVRPLRESRRGGPIATPPVGSRPVRPRRPCHTSKHA